MNPLLIDFPDEFQTERLTIRAPRAGDGAEVNAAIRDSLAELKLWMPWAQVQPTVEESEANIRGAMAKFVSREDLRLLLFLKGTGTLVGSSGLHRVNWVTPRFEIGYWVRTPFARLGYVTEAVAGITEFGRAQLGARRVEIRAAEKNVRSWRIPEKLGFVHEGTLRNWQRGPQGDLHDLRVYAKTF
jgi:RimJ/RimL family protein N-acetyltransferase